MSLSKNLKKIRKENNLSQEQLADKLGVSRQAVSKWESDQAYPEMEKMVTICKMFNLNIDELLNQDVSEVNDTKQSKVNINKYIDDFLGYITKTIDMFSSMSFKTKVKCIFEQIVIIGVIALLFVIIWSIAGGIILDILMFLPEGAYYVIYRIVEDIYLILCFTLGVIMVLHIFKVRYLDYYVIDRCEVDVDIDSDIQEKNEEDEKKIKVTEEKNRKVYLERKQTKVIIRDPENAGYKFISLLFRWFLFCVKLFVGMFAGVFCFSLVCLCLGLVLSFLFVKTGLVFFGTLLAIISIIIVNLIVLNVCYNFLVSRKCKKNKLALVFVISLIMLGVGGGLFMIGTTEFDVILNDSDYEEEVVVIPFRDDMIIWSGYNINYIPSDNDDLRVVYNISKFYDLSIEEYGDGIVHFYPYCNYLNVMDVIREGIRDINDKKLVDYSYVKIDIYTSAENISKLKNNEYNYYG